MKTEMKKTGMFGLWLLLSSLVLSLSGCDDEKTIGYEDLPGSARAFIEQYFPGRSVVRAQREKDDGTRQYEATLDDGPELSFDASGSWYEVDCKFSLLPEGIIPETIASDMRTRYPDAAAHKIERQLGGYEITVNGSLELIYAADGTFICEQRDY